jgi:putative flippase GtrA
MKQSVRQRLAFFLLGAVVNYLLIALPFKYLSANTSLPVWAKAACSVGAGTTFFFLWNYFVNFRTSSRKRDAFLRYITVVIVMWGISSLLLTVFKHFNIGIARHFGGSKLDFDVITTQLCMGWVKFLIYHKWAFPVASGPEENTPGRN